MFIICGWLISSEDVYADNATISGQYLYVSSSICPNISEGQRLCYYYLGGADAHDYYWYTATYIYVSSPEVVGNQIRYIITGAWHEDGDDNPREYHSGPCAPPTSGTMNVPYYAEGHSFSNYSSATCTSPATQRCSRCRTIKAYGNALGHIPGAAATCTTPQKCTRSGCGAVIKAALNHNWGSGNGSVTQNQSCTLPEIRYNKCTRCSATNGTKQTKSALGHNWQTATLTNNNGVKIQPDVYTAGTYYQKCSRCSTGHSGDPYTNHYNVVPDSKLNFQIYNNGLRINKIYLGSILVMNATSGNEALVK